MRARSPSFVVAAVILASGAVASPAAAHPAGPLDVEIPPGWTQISSTSATDALKRTAPQLLASLGDPRIAFAAADLSGGPSVSAPNVNVTLEDGLAFVTQAYVDKSAAEVAKSIGDALHVKVDIALATVVRIHDVACGRVTFDLTNGSVGLRELQYYVPTERQVAVVTYTFPRAVADAGFPLADAAMQRTRGAVDHSPFKLIGRFAIIVVGGLALITAIALVVQRLRKTAA